MPEERRGRLDRAIDRAVREMVQADPRPGLDTRVRDRIHGSAASATRRTPGFTSRSRWHVPALAAAASLVVVLGALLVLRPPETTMPEDARVADVEPAPGPAPGPRTEAAVTGGPPPVTHRATAPAVASTPRRAGNIFGERTGRVRAADLLPPVERAPSGSTELAGRADDGAAALAVPGGLAPLEPITLAPIRLAPLGLSPVTVSALPGGK